MTEEDLIEFFGGEFRRLLDIVACSEATLKTAIAKDNLTRFLREKISNRDREQREIGFSGARDNKGGDMYIDFAHFETHRKFWGDGE